MNAFMQAHGSVAKILSEESGRLTAFVVGSLLDGAYTHGDG